MSAASLQAPNLAARLRSTWQSHWQKLQWVSMRWVSSRQSSSRLAPGAGGPKASLASRMPRQRAKNRGVSRSISSQSSSSEDWARDTATGIVRAMRNLAGLRLAATARYQPSDEAVAGSSQIQS